MKSVIDAGMLWAEVLLSISLGHLLGPTLSICKGNTNYSMHENYYRQMFLYIYFLYQFGCWNHSPSVPRMLESFSSLVCRAVRTSIDACSSSKHDEFHSLMATSFSVLSLSSDIALLCFSNDDSILGPLCILIFDAMASRDEVVMEKTSRTLIPNVRTPRRILTEKVAELQIRGIEGQRDYAGSW